MSGVLKYSSKRIVVKVGSNVLAGKSGFLNRERVSHLVEQMTNLANQGAEVIVVSSGAVATGREMIIDVVRSSVVETRQLFAAVGQVRLMNTWAANFEKHSKLTAQVLLTKEDFKDRVHYLNIKSCLDTLLKNKVIPIINENDVVSVTELMFTDNDELAGLIAAITDAWKLIILTNVNGIYDGHPESPDAKVIETLGPEAKLSSFIGVERSEFGRGGMLTKAHTARKIAALGIGVHIANGTIEHILRDVLSGNISHTHFLAGKKPSAKKKWIAHSESLARGMVYINNGAIKAITSGRAASILPVGISSVNGAFKKGDLVSIADGNGNLIGAGIAAYGADKLAERKGLQHQRPFIHYDYLHLNQ